MRYFDIGPRKWLIRGLLLIVFFGLYLYQLNTYFLLLPLVALAIILNGRRLERLDTRVQWVLFIVMLILTTITSVRMVESIKYTYMVIAVVLVVGQAVKAYDYREYVLNAVRSLCAVEALFVILQYCLPSFVNGINRAILPPDLYSSMMHNLTVGSSYAGIAADPPNAMFFSSILFAYNFIKYIITSRKRYIPVIIASLIAIFLTGKRSALVILIGALTIMSLVYTFKQRKMSLKMLVFAVSAIAVGVYVLLCTPIGSVLIAKNTALINSGDISNGRFFLMREMYAIFRSRPITGIGPLTIQSYYGEHLGHNIYFQCLAENGFLGIVALLVLLAANLRANGRYLDEISRHPEYYCESDICFGYLSLFIQLFFIIYGFLGNPLYGQIFLITYVMFSMCDYTALVQAQKRRSSSVANAVDAAGCQKTSQSYCTHGSG